MKSSVDVYIIGSAWNAVIAQCMVECSGRESIYLIEGSGEASIEASKNSFIDRSNVIFYQDIEEIMLSGVLFGGGLRKLFSLKKIFKDSLDRVMKKINGRLINDIYVFNLKSPLSIYFLSNVRFNKLYKVEDGINDYISVGRPAFHHIKNIFKFVFSLFLGMSRYYSVNGNRFNVEASYFLFPEKVPHLESVNSLMPIAPVIADYFSLPGGCAGYGDFRNSVLFLGQSLSEDGLITLDDEVRFHKKYLSELLVRYPSVVFKPHPRSKKLKLEKIIESLSGDAAARLLVFEQPIAVEKLLLNNEFICVVGFWSLPIIYSDVIFGINSYTLMHSLFDDYPEIKGEPIYSVHRQLEEVFFEQYKQYRLDRCDDF